MTQLAGDDSFIEEKKMADSGETLVFFGIIITFILRKFISFSRKLCACHIDYMRIIWSINGLEIHTMTKVSTNISLDANLKKKSGALCQPWYGSDHHYYYFSETVSTRTESPVLRNKRKP